MFVYVSCRVAFRHFLIIMRQSKRCLNEALNLSIPCCGEEERSRSVGDAVTLLTLRNDICGRTDLVVRKCALFVRA